MRFCIEKLLVSAQSEHETKEYKEESLEQLCKLLETAGGTCLLVISFSAPLSGLHFISFARRLMHVVVAHISRPQYSIARQTRA
jgi:hypothetical protein